MIDKSNSKKNTKRRIKSEIVDSKRNSGTFFLQKYEIIIMLLGAAIISVLIFFVFLKPTGDINSFKTATNSESTANGDLKKQIDRLEAIVKKSDINKNNKSKDSFAQSPLSEKSAKQTYEDHEKRIERIESSLSIKYETLASKIHRLERSIDQLSKKLDNYKRTTKKRSGKVRSVKVVRPTIVKKSKKKATKKNITPPKKSIFHTVKKGDTLYSLSKQYGISVSKLEKINHLPKNANIYPGDNLLVK